MISERLVNLIANRQTTRRDAVVSRDWGKKMPIIREPIREQDMPVELPANPFNPNKPQLDPVTLPGELLPFLDSAPLLPARKAPRHIRLLDLLG
jgi:hypothetical protein